MSRQGAGRPSLLETDPELLGRIVTLVEQGVDPPVAAGKCRVSRSSFNEWMTKGLTDPESVYGKFRTEITRAGDEFEANGVPVVLGGDGPGTSFGPAKAMLEVLSRRHPKRWAQRVKHEVTESQRLCFEALSRVCNNPAIIQRVCETKDCGVVFEAFCEELARLDGEGDSPGEAGSAQPEGEVVH